MAATEREYEIREFVREWDASIGEIARTTVKDLDNVVRDLDRLSEGVTALRDDPLLKSLTGDLEQCVQDLLENTAEFSDEEFDAWLVREQRSLDAGENDALDEVSSIVSDFANECEAITETLGSIAEYLEA